MKFSIIKKNKILAESTLDENTIILKNQYSTIILISKIIVALLYAFGLGYSLFFLGDDFIKEGLFFLVLLIISYILIEYPYSLIKALLLPKVYNKDNINLQLNLFTMAIDINSKIKIPKIRIIISLIVPFILLAIIPTITSYILEFNMSFYLVASSAAIIGIKDIIYLFIILKNYSKFDAIKLEEDRFILYKY